MVQVHGLDRGRYNGLTGTGIEVELEQEHG